MFRVREDYDPDEPKTILNYEAVVGQAPAGNSELIPTSSMRRRIITRYSTLFEGRLWDALAYQLVCTSVNINRQVIHVIQTELLFEAEANRD